MLLASVIQGQVVAVYNTEKQAVCSDQEHQEQAAGESGGTPSPQAESLPLTVKHWSR